MNTFLPYPDIKKSVECLDNARLGKQRVEAKQIWSLLKDENPKYDRGWVNHPAVLMWKGYEEALGMYVNASIDEWVRRGKVNNMQKVPVGKVVYPPWFGNEKFHEAQRSNLLRKDPKWYGKFGWTDPPDLDYVWPVRKGI